ncbi:MAG: cadherin-like domain-containing protein, partial [Methylobacteriaceae bacterium]|nr:cadherin-like domain-containing protein [Methylobacteriaceae bacterium]
TATTTFTYRATDSHGLSSAVKTVSITVVGNDHPPVASDVAVSTAPDQPVTHGFAATDPDVGDHLTYTVVSGPAQGSAAVNADGTFTYDPGHAFDALKPGQTAIASFTYKAIDQNGLSSAVQTVTVTVEGVDHPPTASNVSVTTPQNAPVTHAFAASDPDQGDTLTYAIVSGPTQGSVAVNADGSFTFDPGHAFDALTRGQTATVSFTYQATDQGGLSSGVATVTVTVDGIDHAPVASDVAVTTTPDVPVTHTFAATDPDSGDVLTYAIVAGPSQGSVAINANGTFTYDPGHAFDGLADGQSGSVTFTYEATDQSGLSSGVQTVTVTVAAETATVVGTAGNDTLYGTTGADIFDGKGGSDYEQGNGGSDTFIFKAGYGQLRINERDADPNSNSVLELGVGISPSQVSVTTDGNGNLFLNIGSNGDRVQLDAMLSDPNQGVRAVHFADGTVWTRQQVIAAEMVGTSGNDWIDGTTGADIFDGKGGNDFVRGNGGNDTFIFNAGYGQLRINEHDVNPYADNVLHLGAGITASSVAVTTDGNGSLILNIGSNGDRVLLDDMLWDPTYGVQAVDFADGTVWTRQQVIAKELTGSSGNDWIDGTSGADTFDGKGGNDYERGNGGNDTFIFNAGYGQLRITEHDTSPYADNVLKLGTGISPAAVLVTTDGNGNLFLNIGTNGDRVLLDGMLTDPTYGVQAVDFADGTVWTRQQVIAKEMAGTSGNDWIDGTSGADVIDGKGGNDYERGDGGNDTFIFNAGYGQLRINEHDTNPAADNVLQLGSGITPNAVAVSNDGNGNLILNIGSNGDRVQLDAMLADPSYGVQAINFADGTVWTRQQVIALSGATGSTRTIYYNAGAGHVEFNQQDWNQADDNVLQLGDGITPASVTTSTDGNGNLYLNIGSSGDRVQLDGMFASAAYGVGRVQFADGAVWTRQQAIAMAMTGTSGNDILYGTSGADVFDGKGGNDYEQGNGGNDTFIFNAGYGQLRISEQDWNPAAHNVLALGAGITPDAVHATSDGDGNVFLTIGSNGDRVQIDSMLASPVDGVQSVQFADGTVWSRAQIIAKLTVGTPGNDILYGTTGADVFDGKGGNDYEQGNGGNDTFIFNAGYGQLRISEQDFNPAADNILRLGTGIVPASVVVSADGDGNLFLTLGGNGDRIQLDGMFASAVRGVQSVQFADGTLWTRQQMIAMEMTGSSGNDVLYGTTGADVIDGKGGNDYEQGNGGNDTFIFNAGYGQLRINEQDWNPAAHNVLQLGAGIAPGSVAASSDGNGNLILNIGSNGDRIEIDGMLANAVYGIQAIDFADGTVWTRAQVFNLAATATSA